MKSRCLAFVLSAVLCASVAHAQELPITQVRFVAGPDISTFAQTTSITQVAVQANGTELQFNKKDGAGRWPDNVTPGWQGSLQYSIGMCLNVEGQWVCSAPIEVWFGRVGATGPIQDNTVSCKQGFQGQVACNWFYDVRWGPLVGHQPNAGEQIGVFVVAGDARSNFNPVKERSNIVLLTMPSPGETRTFNYSEVAPQPTTPTPLPPVSPPAPTPASPSIIPSDLNAILLRLDQIDASIARFQDSEEVHWTNVKNTFYSVVKSPVFQVIVTSFSTFLITHQVTK